MANEPASGLFFEEYGQPDQPALVFLHGGGAGGWMWRQQVEFFKGRFHCLVPDLPEQGRSRDVKPFSNEYAADCIAGLIRARVPDARARVVGLSEGAQVLVALISRHPEVVESAMCSSAALLPMPGYKFYTRGMFRAAYRWFMEPFKNSDGWIRLNMKYSTGIPQDYYADFKHSFQEISESGFVNLMYESTHFTLPAGLEKADLPVLVTAGEREYGAMIQSARELVTVLPRAQGALISLGRSSSLAKEHNWAMTAPDLFNETLAAWIEKRPLPDGLKRLL